MKPINKFILLFLLALSTTLINAQEIKKWKLNDLEAAIKNSDKPTILNFWATFCKPCIEELPYFQKAAKKYDSAGVQLILVSLDLPEAYPKKINAFAAKNKILAPIVFLDETNADLFCPAVDAKWSGAIPASLFINNKTGYRKFFEDQLSKEQVEKEIISMLNSK
ncbi:MAG: TlpA family protein disulfide reductase [Chitinophagaceae bacterium]